MTGQPAGRVAIFGGGMAGLATAWSLSAGDWRARYRSITVYQRGWRLGGKGASSRGRHGRIEEHGLHLLLGYYHSTFRLLDEVYRELDRPRTRPDCPIQTLDDAVRRAPVAGVVDDRQGEPEPWWAAFPVDDDRPGIEPNDPDGPLFSPDMLRQAGRLLVALSESLATRTGDIATLSSTPPPPPDQTPDDRQAVASTAAAFGLPALLAALVGAEQLVAVGHRAGLHAGVGDQRAAGRLATHVFDVLESLAEGARAAVDADPRARRTADVVELLVTALIGLARDGVLAEPDRIRELDAEDYRDWLKRHGASAELLASPLIRGLYDLVFAYEGGDPARPRFAAGVGLELAVQMFLNYRGSLFWHMTAGMGEIVFAPLYECLRRRGVAFEFFHRLDEITCDDDGASVTGAVLTRQVDGALGFEPLVEVSGLPAWPDRPDPEQLGPLPGDGLDLELAWSTTEAGGRLTLRRGVDFDIAVLAVSLGAVADVVPAIVERQPRWRAMTETLGTVPTQAFQLWCRDDEAALGWRGGAGVAVSGYTEPFDTWASMSHLLERESWPDGDRPGSIAYFCSAMTDRPVLDADQAALANDEVKAGAIRFLDRDVSVLWPAAVESGRDGDDPSFRWSTLCDGDGGVWPDQRAFDTQYWRANVDPSDRYVQSLPGTNHLRIRPGETGVEGLVVAGDWTDTGLNAGCIEAATRSGVLAAAAVAEALGCGLDTHGVDGTTDGD